MFKTITTLVFSALITSSLPAAEPTLTLAAPFTNNMILQRQSDVPVWGFDTPGSKITIEFAGQIKTTTTDKNGDWLVKLTPLKASVEERNFIVKNNQGSTVTLKNILVGEVWFSSGQSNMVWIAAKSMCRELANEISKSEKDIPIREININTVSALYPQHKATSDGGWKTSKSASNFSALSLSFAHELYKELNVPIGILLSAHSNTRIEAFTQRQAIETHPKLTGDNKLMLDADPLTDQGLKAYEKYYQDLQTWQDEAGKIAVAGGKIPQRPNLP
ncbi:MAG: hypothetical protein P8O22_10155, partial [Akkermansiaceae bacterium]|nr:hypothetical protein [Akkermansiaceae bacterium]